MNEQTYNTTFKKNEPTTLIFADLEELLTVAAI